MKEGKTALSDDVDCESSKNDVIFVVGNESTEIYGIRELFSKHSEVFSTMFLDKSCNKQVIIPDVSPKVFKWLKSYVYGYNPSLTPENVIDITLMSDKFGIKSLYDKCVEYIDQIELKFQNISNTQFIAQLKLGSLKTGQLTIFPLQAMRSVGNNFGKNLELNGANSDENNNGINYGMGINSSRERTMEAISILGSTEDELIGKLIVVVSQKERNIQVPSSDQLNQIGYLSEIIEVKKYEPGKNISYDVMPRAKIGIAKIIGCMVLCRIITIEPIA